MTAKRYFIGMSDLALRGLERAAGGKVDSYLSPSGKFIAVTEGRRDPASVKVIERYERMKRERQGAAAAR